MSRLEIKGVTKRYKKETVLDSVSLSVDEGKTLVLFGPSGAGKTVLLRLIAGVIDPDEGAIVIDDEDVTDVEAQDRRIGMAFQNFALFPHMTAFDNIASPLVAARLSTDEIRDGVGKVADLLKIGHVTSHMPRELSNGQKQRTALARALVGEPPILLLDDPLRNVDAKLRFEMRLELPSLLRGRGTTVIYVTQDYKEAMALGDQIAVLTEGVVTQHGTPAEIYLKPANIEIARLFGDPVINSFDVVPRAADNDANAVCVELSDTEIPLPYDAKQWIGNSCVFGIRPEYISFVAPGTAGSLPVNIEAETPINEKIITLATTLGGRELLISRPAGTPGAHKEGAFVELKPDSGLLFDQASGKLLQGMGELAEPGAAA
ncbi:MAG: ABC transporter ATP-binding protein [Granulosicoccus sp.]|nr:ABC transporter ATP-binding protein [Granulosicoccus sp.]